MEFLNRDTEWVPARSIKPHPHNPNRGDVEAIRESIQAHGFYGHVVVQQETRRILVGEHRWRAALEEGADQVPVLWVNVDDQEAEKILLVDNRTAELAKRDKDALVDVLSALLEQDEGTVGTGYTQAEAEAIVGAFEDEEREEETPPPWPTIQFQLPPEDKEKWEAALARFGHGKKGIKVADAVVRMLAHLSEA